MYRGVALLVCGLLSACSGSTPVPQATKGYEPSTIAQAALQELDKNKNGTIEGAELDGSPALRWALAVIDKNGDQKISASEIEKRVAAYTGQVGVICSATMDGKPLVGATVTFEPEKFMGEGWKPVTTVLDWRGYNGALQVDGRPVAGLMCGFYRIRITKDDLKIPARYNTQTTLGREICPEPRQSGDITVEFAISSR